MVIHTLLPLRRVKRVKHCYCGSSSQDSHKGANQLDGSVGKDHDNISIGNAGIVQVVGNGVGGLVDLAIGEYPGWRAGTNVSSSTSGQSKVSLT